jgi:uncharacterized SAM-binding protein YcdF (DUF218 family)
LNSLFVFLGVESWKPVLAALLLPPAPLLLLLLIGARLLLPRRGLGWFIVLLSVALLWLSTCVGTGAALNQFLLRPPVAVNPLRIAEIKTEVQAKQATAIVVLGAGMEPFAPEYGVSSLQPATLERLRYGLWLSRETGAPVVFAGAAGAAQVGSTPEAQVAARVAAQEFGRPIKSIDETSRDTNENAARGIALLKEAGIKHALLVTHGWQMPRAQRAFEAAAGGAVRIEAAPVGLGSRATASALTWLPTAEGMTQVRQVLRELLSRVIGD